MDRLNDPPATGQDSITDNDHGILGAVGQNEGSKDETERILGGGEPQAGGTPANEMPDTRFPGSDSDMVDTPSAASNDSDTVGTDSPHTDTGAGSDNLTSVGGNRS